MHVRKLLTFQEPQVDTILRRRLEKEGYRVHAKVRLSDAIAKDRGEYLEEREFGYLTRAHLDFLVTKDNRPLFAVEFDECHHLEDKETIERDTVKNRLCKAAGLPLLRIGAAELTNYDQVTTLDYMVDRYVSWLKEKDELFEMVEDYAQSAPEDAAPEDLAVDLDPTFWFDLRHPFPGTPKVEERLWRRHRILSTRRTQPERWAEARYECHVHLQSTDQLEHDQFITYRSVAVVRPARQPQGDIVHSAPATASVREWLPTEVAIPGPLDLGDLFVAGSPDFVEQMTRRIDAMWFPRLPGISPWSVAENLSRYLALREIERWADKQLGSEEGRR